MGGNAAGRSGARFDLVQGAGQQPAKPVNKRPPTEPYDEVQEASEESFPASDPPSYTPITGP